MFFKKKGMVLGKRAWRGAMLKQAGGNTSVSVAGMECWFS